ncbi:hypothetical protein DesfrDRAFT_0847 [Solidesulfovibrio fructosivorans JJ]]|uniref:Uncharacterized protein n=1 Tax=Solidesulfovibrio fructosivorans JJ] TaxID=596151 RepID=E1JT98_SOLFR|nr:hypothetical protein [Solidesulfovibrio fructosivorans]EFL52358.1 hypothetical protein DesfrDRAFT_0847 [Solidesulfovibrio fructosivorans JJ]]
MRNSTFLTETRKGAEEQFWTPCFVKFLSEKVEIPISVFLGEKKSPPWFSSRKVSPFITYDEIFVPKKQKGISGKDLVRYINNKFKTSIGEDAFIEEEGDVSGIIFDLVLASKTGIYILENKPYDRITFSWNQRGGNCYEKYVKRINDFGVDCQLLYILSIGIDNSSCSEISTIQQGLGDKFGIILLEHLFELMDKHKFEYQGISNWKDFSLASPDYQ